MADEERKQWEQRYRTEQRRTDPSAFLLEVGGYLPEQGTVLDAGGGNGRNAIWLAGRGLTVTVLDIAEPALLLANRAAKAAGVEIRTLLADLDDGVPSGPWDVIVDFHLLKRDLFPRFRDVIRAGGLLVFCQATVRNLERHERPPRRHLLQVGEGWDLLAGFELLIAREGWSVEGRHEFEALARVPGGAD